MNTQELIKLRRLAGFVGDFIRYWGFRRVHGQIWTLIYLSQEPLSGIQIVERLEVSKALVSPALRELEQEGLIHQTESENSKTKRYVAEENIEKIIKGVLNRREKPMMNQIAKSFADLNVETSSSLQSARLNSMATMIETAQMSLTFLLNSKELLD